MPSFFIVPNFDVWMYLKNGKNEVRRTSNGFEYNYSEGGMIFPAPLDNRQELLLLVKEVSHRQDSNMLYLLLGA